MLNTFNSFSVNSDKSRFSSGKKSYFYIVIFLITVFSLNLNAQTADKVIEKYIKAIGGYDNIKKVKTLRLTGNVYVHGLALPLTVTLKRPNLARFEVTFNDVSQVQVYDGTMGWMTDFMTGGKVAKKMSKNTEADIKHAADFEGVPVDYKTKGYSAWLTGKEKVDSIETYKLGFANSSGDTIYYYIDTKSSLLVKKLRVKQDGKIPVETIFKGYIETEKVKFPASTEVKTGDSEDIQVIKFDKAEVNINVDDAIFKMPEDE